MVDALVPQHDGTASRLPVNAATGKLYSGINIVVLWATAQAEGYQNATWTTYCQWQELGAQVHKGEQSSPVVFWKINGQDEGEERGSTGDGNTSGGGESSEGDRRSRMLTRGYSVFNAAQVDDYAAPALLLLPRPERIGHAETFFAGLGADVRHGGNRACYVPDLDQVRMPLFPAFHDAVAYYATLAHEATHWTGHVSRSARDLRDRFGEKACMRSRSWWPSLGRRSSAPTWRRPLSRGWTTSHHG